MGDRLTDSQPKATPMVLACCTTVFGLEMGGHLGDTEAHATPAGGTAPGFVDSFADGALGDAGATDCVDGSSPERFPVLRTD